MSAGYNTLSNITPIAPMLHVQCDSIKVVKVHF